MQKHENLNPVTDVTVEFPLSHFPNIQNHPNLEIIEDHIWVIHDFITPEERNYYITVGENATEEEWFAHHTEWWRGKFLPMPQNHETDRIIGNLTQRLNHLIGYGDYVVGAPMSVHRMHEGEYMFDHADNPHDEGMNNHVLTSFVLYMNDFNGGNIYYEHLGLEYHPKGGDLLIHPGTERYRHGTRPVEAGPTRYVATMWTYDPAAEALHAEGRVFEESDVKSPLAFINEKKPPRLIKG